MWGNTVSEFEYKLFSLPKQLDNGQAIVTSAGEFAPTLQRQINLIVENGWEFVGREEIPVERRQWLLLKRRETDDYLVFRRPAAVPGSERRPAPGLRAGSVGVKPRRVIAQGTLQARKRPVMFQHTPG